jgi:glycerophosphoryl diester phosphodiesterase
LVVAHRGSVGLGPEQTLEAYTRAIGMGAVLEFDVIATKDGVLIARHDPNLAIGTDVARHPEFAARRRSARLDAAVEEGWFASDFTLAEIKTLTATSPHGTPPAEGQSGPRVATVQEIIDLAKRMAQETGRSIWVYPETKNPSYHRDLGLALEDRLLDLLEQAGWNHRDAPVYIQSFEPSSLKYMRQRSPVRMVQLIDADDVDLRTGKLVYAIYNRPYDWTLAGDERLFSAMVTPAGLAEIKTYADGIGPWKRYIVSLKGALDDHGELVDRNGDGKLNAVDATTLPPTTLIADAHAAGLFVHPYTFRDPESQLAADYDGDPKREYRQFFALGVDAVFSDYAHTALAARAEYLRELEHTIPLLRAPGDSDADGQAR